MPLFLHQTGNGYALWTGVIEGRRSVSARQTQMKDEGVDHDRCGHAQGLIVVVLLEDVGDCLFGAFADLTCFTEDACGRADTSDDGVGRGLYCVFGDGCVADECCEVFEVSGDEALLREAVEFVWRCAGVEGVFKLDAAAQEVVELVVAAAVVEVEGERRATTALILPEVSTMSVSRFSPNLEIASGSTVFAGRYSFSMVTGRPPCR